MYAAMYMGEGMIMEHERVKNTLLVKISGELDHCSAERIRREMDRLLAVMQAEDDFHRKMLSRFNQERNRK